MLTGTEREEQGEEEGGEEGRGDEVCGDTSVVPEVVGVSRHARRDEGKTPLDASPAEFSSMLWKQMKRMRRVPQ